MTTSDNQLPSAKRGELATAIQRGTDELRTIGHEMTVTKAFGKLGMLAVKGIPVVGPVIDAAKELSQGLIDRENRERQRRLQDYVLGVVRDEQYNDTVEFREEDVIPVIRKLAADDETAKTEYYTRLTVSLGRTPLSVMPDDLRYHFIRLVSSLTSHLNMSFKCSGAFNIIYIMRIKIAEGEKQPPSVNQYQSYNQRPALADAMSIPIVKSGT
ncbi:hypothetical protein GKU42_01760 [Salmonella enterica]|nr:hypothetical protein [Salmonella enterica subsp. enterica serovar Alabama]EEM7296836.1 hypothetical protein [Salmonella enterica]SUH23706.1 Uncharacterised protein [Salmonella enterica subsp. enterica]